MSKQIDFYFDFASPYGYFAAREIEALAARQNATVTWRPILLGAVFKATGSQPNLAAPLRGDYLRHDVARIARMLGLPLVIPSSAPVKSVAPARLFYWLDAGDPALAKDYALAAFDAHWLRGHDIGQLDEALAPALSLGLDAAAARAGMEDPAVKDRLRAETDRAIERGVFGSPFFCFDDQRLWGWDRLPMLEAWLKSGGW